MHQPRVPLPVAPVNDQQRVPNASVGPTCSPVVSAFPCQLLTRHVLLHLLCTFFDITSHRAQIWLDQLALFLGLSQMRNDSTGHTDVSTAEDGVDDIDSTKEECGDKQGAESGTDQGVVVGGLLTGLREEQQCGSGSAQKSFCQDIHADTYVE